MTKVSMCSPAWSSDDEPLAMYSSDAHSAQESSYLLRKAE